MIEGMTLRDWFAGQVLQGLCVSGAARDLGEMWGGQRGWDGHSDPHKFIRDTRGPQIAADCYAIANAIMRARDNDSLRDYA